MEEQSGVTWHQVLREADLLRERFQQHPHGVLLSTFSTIGPPTDGLGYYVAGPFTLSEIRGYGWLRGVRLKKISSAAMLAVRQHQVWVVHETETLEVPVADVKLAGERTRYGRAVILTAPGHLRSYLLTSGGSLRDGSRGPSEFALILAAAATIWATCVAEDRPTEAAESLLEIVQQHVRTCATSVDT